MLVDRDRCSGEEKNKASDFFFRVDVCILNAFTIHLYMEGTHKYGSMKYAQNII